MKEYAAKHIGEFTHAIVAISRDFDDAKPWWRGHSNIGWQLVPSLYRKGMSAKESNLNTRFRMMAKARHASCPTGDAPYPWLFLMQHYHLPTRLLDWSESPLVALYFALEADVDEPSDAAVWALHPSRLNLQQLGEEKICSYGSREVLHLGKEAFVPNRKQPDTKILSLIAEQSDPRHMAQQCAFTVHGSDSSIKDLPKADNYLARIRIPKEAKKGFRQTLSLFGISRATLFPDLENLATELSATNFSEPGKQ